MFLDPLRVEYVDEDSTTWKSIWRLTCQLRFHSERLDRTFTVPAGFKTDFASVPRIPIAFELDGAIAESCATLHDYLYSTGEVSRSDADHLLEEAMKSRGFGWLRRWSIFAGVRLFGGRFYNKGDE